MRAGRRDAMKSFDRAGRTAYIRYRGGVAGELPHDDRSQDEPLAVRIGAHRVPKGVERALDVLEVGDSCTLVIPPEEGYGEADPKLVRWYPRSVLDHGYDMKEGTMVMWQSADGLAAKPASIVDATKDAVKIDLNHPYAGKTLEYWVELVDLT
ncbi:peptidylprolyl isomerase [Gordonibacter sp. 28C]|nr:peptidylprolyl isomerase [Gordonibacter sp. 28C]